MLRTYTRVLRTLQRSIMAKPLPKGKGSSHKNDISRLSDPAPTQSHHVDFFASGREGSGVYLTSARCIIHVPYGMKSVPVDKKSLPYGIKRLPRYEKFAIRWKVYHTV